RQRLPRLRVQGDAAQHVVVGARGVAEVHVIEVDGAGGAGGQVAAVELVAVHLDGGLDEVVDGACSGPGLDHVGELGHALADAHGAHDDGEEDGELVTDGHLAVDNQLAAVPETQGV